MSIEEKILLLKRFEEKVEPKIMLDDEFTKNGTREAIILALANIYITSKTARDDMFDKWIDSGGLIHIDYMEGVAAVTEDENDSRGKVLSFDAKYPPTYIYINNNGLAVQSTLQSVLVHELVHIMKNTGDTGLGGSQFEGDRTDLKGETVIYANKIYKELGIPEQNSYIGADDLGILESGRQYTPLERRIDRSEVVIGSQLYMPELTPGSRDLLIGDGLDNELKTGGGDDFLYGNAGNDWLFGGEGDDYLYGGDDDDHLYGDGDDEESGEDEKKQGQGGSDHLYGGEGNDHLWGGMGDDYLYGEGGEDYLHGGTGLNYLYGGKGEDTYYIGAPDEGGKIIFDFQAVRH